MSLLCDTSSFWCLYAVILRQCHDAMVRRDAVMIWQRIFTIFWIFFLWRSDYKTVQRVTFNIFFCAVVTSLQRFVTPRSQCFLLMWRHHVLLKVCDARMLWPSDAIIQWCCDAVIQWCCNAVMLWCSDAVMLQCSDAVTQWCCNAVML